MKETMNVASNEESATLDEVAEAIRELQQFELIEDQPAAQYPPRCLSCS